MQITHSVVWLFIHNYNKTKFDDCFGYNFNVLQKLCDVFRGYMIGQAVVNANYTFCRLVFYT